MERGWTPPADAKLNLAECATQDRGRRQHRFNSRSAGSRDLVPSTEEIGSLIVRVLIVEDEKKVAAAVRRGLEAEGFAVDIALTGTDGLWMAT
jgi:PleD family two-component response regulator